MFADETNLFYSDKSINALFLKLNNKLYKINQWHISNRLSLNIKKRKYSFFYKQSKQDDIPLLLPQLKIDNYETKRVESVKSLGVLIYENLTQKRRIKYIENKIAKNFGLPPKAKPFWNKHSRLSLYYSFIHSYINYANVAWGSTYMTKLKKLI